MPQDRFYLDAAFQTDQTLTLEESEFHHLRVLRIAPDEEIDLVNGRGDLAKASVLKLAKHSANLRILSSTHRAPPSPPIILAIALLRMNKLEWAIEKTTELGADAFLLYPADNSEKDDLSPNQLERLRHLAISALKQCGRLYLPSLTLTTLDKILLNPAQILYGDVHPDAPLIPTAPTEPTLFISGPEKGFSKGEEELLRAKGMGVKLNDNILRAETAPLAALSILKRM